MKLTIEFKTDNDSFRDEIQEISRIFEAITNDLSNGGSGSQIRDLNGNTVGIWHYY